ncbi:chaplin [Streptomyces leeuwenhoekii]|uniref:chaplin n=1 Tax=Streptomyces leeuwenhoekii TaxID=1437453 RepID=UPI0036F8C96C
MSRIAKGLVLTSVAAGAVTGTTGVAVAAGAGAGAKATAADSPGGLAGSAVQVPVYVPVNVCGNTVDVGGLLNPAFGNKCKNA